MILNVYAMLLVIVRELLTRFYYEVAVSLVTSCELFSSDLVTLCLHLSVPALFHC